MKKVVLNTLFLYLIILTIGIVAAVRVVSLVMKKSNSYRGSFDSAKVVVDDRLFTTNYVYKTGIRGNIYSAENDLMLSTIYIYDLYWYPSEVVDSAKFMQNADSLISIFMQINPRMTFQEYEKMIKETYLEYRKDYRRCMLNSKSENDAVRQNALNELKELKKRYKIIKISKATKANEWVTQEHWDKICSLFPAKSKLHGGCKVDKRLVHNNVYKNCATATVGYLNVQQSKKYTDSIVYDRGIEGYYDSLLAEERLVYKRLYVNNVLVPLRENRKVNPQNGADIITTINIDIQRITENALMDKLIQTNAAWGCAIVMEVETGEIKSISNLTRTREGIYEETVDHAIRESYEPGSTFKLITLLAALESKKVDTSTIVPCEENRKFSLCRAFEISDNDGLYNAAKIAYSNYYDFFMAIMKMSLQKNLNIEVAKAQIPVLKSITQREVDYRNVTHGYSIKVPPIYMLAYYNAIANDGKYIQPILVKSIRYPNNKVVEKYAEVINPQICSKATIKKAQACLEKAVTHGTGMRARDDNYKMSLRDTSLNVRPLIAGKTGTAFIFDEKEKKYSNIKNSSFIGYFPSENPKYSCLVLISQTTLDGGHVAAPVCKEIAEKIASRDDQIAWSQTNKGMIENAPTVKFGKAEDMINIYTYLGYKTKYPRSQHWVQVVQEDQENKLIFEKKDIKKQNIASQLRGATAKDAVYLLEKLGYKVVLQGVGKVNRVSFSDNEVMVELKN